MPKISALPSTTPTTSGVVPFVQSGTTVTTTLGALFDTLTGFLQSGASAIARTIRAKLQETVSAADFTGFDATGVTSSTAALTAAFTSLGSTGGTVIIPRGAKVLIDTTLTIPANCHLVGPHVIVGTPGTNSSAPYANLGGSLRLNSAATINLSPGSSIQGLLIYRKAMTFPAADSSAYAGTAVTLSFADDAAILSCLIIGFNKAVISTSSQRTRINYLWFDCVNGVEITACPDIPYITNCHGWPFGTIGTFTGLNISVLQRSGTAYHMHDLVDWPRLENCFSFGYLRGLIVNNANNGKFVNVGADGGYTGSAAFEILGTSTDNTFLNCQSSGHDNGAIVNTVAGGISKFVSCDFWASPTRSVLITAGDAQFLGGQNRDTPYGFTINNANSLVEADGIWFTTIGTAPFQFSVANPNVHIGENNNYGALAAGTSVITGTYVPKQIASVDPLPLPPNAKTITVTAGGASIGSITGGWNGRTVKLVFNAAVQINSSVVNTNSVKLNGGGVFNAVAGSQLRISHDGTQWREDGRCL